MRRWQVDEEGTLSVTAPGNGPIPDKGEKAVQGLMGGGP